MVGTGKDKNSREFTCGGSMQTHHVPTLGQISTRPSFINLSLPASEGRIAGFHLFPSSVKGISFSHPNLHNRARSNHSLINFTSRISIRQFPSLRLVGSAVGDFVQSIPTLATSIRVRGMAGTGKQFPPQQQDQPGREHEMQPTPEFVRPGYKPADKLLGKVAIVTGGDSGIGRSVACHLALEGATVAITYVPEKEEKDAAETLELLKNKYKHHHAKADPIKIPVDLGFDENCKKVVQQVVDTYGRLDILVNNAGEQHTVPGIEQMSAEQVERVFRTNIFSQFFLTKYAVNHMKEGSCIINTTSVNAFKGNASLLDYTSTKGAIVAFTRGLALHLVGRGIRVNAVAPGPIWTPLIPASFPNEKVESFGEEVPMKRAAQPSEVGPSYVFLASEDSSYYTGQCLHPNGGAVVNA